MSTMPEAAPISMPSEPAYLIKLALNRASAALCQIAARIADQEEEAPDGFTTRVAIGIARERLHVIRDQIKDHDLLFRRKEFIKIIVTDADLDAIRDVLDAEYRSGSFAYEQYKAAKAGLPDHWR